MEPNTETQTSGLNINIRTRLILGFAALCLILAIAVGTTLWKVSAIDTVNSRVIGLRVPTAFASTGMVNAINSSLASLRGWMLTGNPVFKTQRSAVWADIASLRGEMDVLSSNWTNPANVEKWSNFKAILDEFAVAQQQVEDIAHTADEHPANKILFEEAAPRASVIIGAITAMINAEANLPATPERKALLGMMADVRGSMGLGLANIRAYLLSGDEKFKALFDKFWATNERRFADLSNNAALFTAEQKASFDKLVSARAEFAPLPPQMFEIRGSNKWNMANYLLITEAAPRAGKLLTTLAGEVGEDGARSGGMVRNQKALLANDVAAAAEDSKQLTMLEWILLIGGLIIAAVITFFTARSIVDPVNSMTGAMGRLADGDLEVEVEGSERQDEIGQMAAAVQVFKDNAIEMKRLESERAEAERRAEEEKRASMNAMAKEFEDSVGGVLAAVSDAAGQMEASAQAMSATAEETSSQAVTVASAAEETSVNVQTVASATEELASSISEIGRQVGESSSITGRAVTETERTNQEVNGLAEAAEQIGEVVSLISKIAEQTNLLALNATIEAARAGEAGRGFAVVASEVKNLASQTAKATEDISSQVGSIQSATGQAVQAIQGIGDTISKVDEIASAIAAAVEEQQAATQEIARNVQEAANGTQEVTSNITGVNQAASETGAAAAQVLSLSGDLSSQSSNLGGAVDDFLATVRSAS